MFTLPVSAWMLLFGIPGIVYAIGLLVNIFGPKVIEEEDKI